jgi:DNA-binding response OmpR family regulator
MNLANLVILVLEDEPIIAMTLEEMLEDEGARPQVHGSIDAALAAVDATQFDAAILDINVHGEKSYPVGRRLGELGVPFVFASGYGDALNTDEFAGVPTLTKPYDLEGIVRALDAARHREFGGDRPA